MRLPTVSLFRGNATAGCLMAYGPGVAEMVHRAVAYVDRILKGTKAADLSIQRPTKFELIINLETANALGLTLADHVTLVLTLDLGRALAAPPPHLG